MGHNTCGLVPQYNKYYFVLINKLALSSVLSTCTSICLQYAVLPREAGNKGGQGGSRGLYKVLYSRVIFELCFECLHVHGMFDDFAVRWKLFYIDRKKEGPRIIMFLQLLH